MLPVCCGAGARPKHFPDLAVFCLLVEDKVWQHVGLTLEEFLALEAAGAYAGDGRPEVVALTNLLSTGVWTVPSGTARRVPNGSPAPVPSPLDGPRLRPSLTGSAGCMASRSRSRTSAGAARRPGGYRSGLG